MTDQNFILVDVEKKHPTKQNIQTYVAKTKARKIKLENISMVWKKF